MEWLFEGLGTSILTTFIGFFAGGAVGYRIGINKSNKSTQRQVAKDNATQIQIGRDYNGN